MQIQFPNTRLLLDQEPNYLRIALKQRIEQRSVSQLIRDVEVLMKLRNGFESLQMSVDCRPVNSSKTEVIVLVVKELVQN